jgi:hypothetical protein
MPMRLYALLVGIDAYAAPVPPLRGCVNDVRHMQMWLEHRGAAHFPPALLTLTDAEATRAAIIQAFRNHLGQAGAGDVALFYYSGHGSQELSPPEYQNQEPDGLDETLVAYDSRQPGGLDIADKELAVLIAEVASRGAHVAIVLDACHSGTATRLAGDLVVRRMSSDSRARPASSFWFFDQAIVSPALQQSATDWRILPYGPHVLLSACRDFELATEFTAPTGERRGMFSYYLLDSLQQMGDMMSYRSLYKRVQTLVGNRNPSQLPQAEGDLDRRVFDGSVLPLAEQMTIRRIVDTGWRLDAGAVHGVQLGSEYAVEPGSGRDPTLPDIPLAVVRVTQLDAAESSVTVIHGSLPADAVALPVVLSYLPIPPLTVMLGGALVSDPNLRATISASPFLTIANDAKAADLMVFAAVDQYQLLRLEASEPIATCANVDEVVLSLNHIARWENVRRLGNHQSPLSEAVRMTVWSWLGAPLAAGDPPQTAPLPENPPHLSYHDIQGRSLPSRFTVEITNTAERPIYFVLLALSESFAIQKIRQAEGRLIPRQTIWIRPQDGIPVSVPDALYARGVTRRQDTLLLLASERDADFSLLEQGMIGTTYNRPTATRQARSRHLLDMLLRTAMTREIDDEMPLVVHAWGGMSATIVAERLAAEHILDGLTDAHELSAGVTIYPPKGFRGTAQLANTATAARSLRAELAPPLVRDSSLPIAPIAIARSADSDSGFSTLSLRYDDCTMVTPATPLTIATKHALAADETLLGVAYDGQDYQLAGISSAKDRSILVLPVLPAPRNMEADDRRGLRSTTWILFQKLTYPHLGLPYQYPLLRTPLLDQQGRVTYVEVDPITVRHAHRIALLLHGIFGESHSMAQDLLQTKLLTHYDLVLTLDYESFNTRVSTTARALKRRLSEVGLGPGHGKTVHCIAHSVGGLIARWLIEREEGAALIQHLVMAGTPNEGSPLPRLQNWAFLGLSLALNHIGGLAPLAPLAGVASGIESFDVTLDELSPDSGTLADLNSSMEAPVPYTAIAGDASGLEQPLRLAGKLARQGVGLAFSGEGHDLFVSYTSMTRIRNGGGPQPNVVAVPCTHVDYFSSPAGQAALSNVLEQLVHS